MSGNQFEDGRAAHASLTRTHAAADNCFYLVVIDAALLNQGSYSTGRDPLAAADNGVVGHTEEVFAGGIHCVYEEAREQFAVQLPADRGG
mgnify:CR=1 FL=1